MLTAKKKIAVREVTAKPTVASQWYRLQEFYALYSKYILGGLAIVAAIVIFAFIYSAGQEADEREASRDLQRVMPLFQQQQYKLAISGDPARGIPGLKTIVENYGGTPSGSLAAVYLGTSYLYSSQFDLALQTFEDASGGNELTSSNILAGIAASYEGKKQYAEAAEMYEKAATSFENDFLSTTRFFNAGRMYCLAGNKEKAYEVLKKVQEANTPRYLQDVQRLMAQYDLEPEG